MDKTLEFGNQVTGSFITMSLLLTYYLISHGELLVSHPPFLPDQSMFDLFIFLRKSKI